MSIQSQITRINTNIANAYDAVTTMGGTLPVTQNSANLPDAIATLAQSDYIQLEWVEGTGTQYIDTGITPNDNYIIEMTASNHSNDDTPYFGAYNTWTTNSLLCYGVLNRVYFAGQGNDFLAHNPTSSTPYTITVSSSVFSVDNLSGPMTSLGAINTTLKLFWGGNRIGKFKLYSAKVWNGNTLVGDYTPVIKKSDGEAGLYDNVSKTFFGNSGSGKFNTNNHDGYIQLEWLESTGSQYINTGINANTIGKIQTKFKSVNANNSTWRSVLYCEDPGGSYPGLGIRINDSNKLQFNYCSAYIPISTAVTPDSSEAANTWYETELDGLNNRVIINNTTYNNTFSGSLPDGNIYVFATEYESAVSQYSSMRISYLKIYNLSNELVRDFIPVLRTTDYEVGLYDKENNQFYGNLGLGFLRPGIKIAGYNIVDNIQSSGSAYFDTGVSGGNKMEYALYLNTMGSKARNYEQYFAGDIAPASHKLYLDGTTNTSPIFAQQTNGNNWSGTSSSSLTLYNNASAKHTISFYNDGKLYLDTTLKGTGVNNGWGTLSYYVFNSHGEPTLISSMAVFQLVMKTDGNVVRFYIPTKRTSDNKYGVYDLVNNTFTPSASNTAFTAGSVSISNDGTNSPYYYTPVVVPTPSTKSGSIANQIDRINENIANAYDVCRQIGRTLPYVQDSELLEPTILDTLSTAIKLYYYLDTTNHILYLRRTPKAGYTDGSQALNSTSSSDIPWYNARVTNIVIEEKIYTNSLNFWFSTFGAYGPIVSNINLLVTDAVTSMNYVVYNSGPNNGNKHLDLRNWNTSNVTNMSNMFWYTNGALESVDLSNFDTSNVTSMYRMFHSTMFTSLDLTSFDTTNVTTMESMFYNCTKLEYLDLSSFDMSNVSNTLSMFTNTNHVVTAYCKDAANKAILDQICEDCGVSWRFTVKWRSTYYRIDNGTLYLRTDNPGNYTDCSTILTSPGSTTIPWYENTSITTVNIETPIKPRRMSYWFWGLENVTNFVNLTNIITDLVTEMQGMFRGCSSLTSLDLSSFDTSNVYNMDNMFHGCSSLTSLDLSNFDTSKVKYMHSMFEDCSSLTSLDLSSFGTSNYITYLDMGWMFYGCSSLTSIDLSNFDMSGTIDTTSMFRSCSNVQTAYCRTQADKTILDAECQQSGVNWRFTIKS